MENNMVHGMAPSPDLTANFDGQRLIDLLADICQGASEKGKRLSNQVFLGVKIWETQN